jgi:hypothetical protein
MKLALVAFLVLGILGLAAWLIVTGHPWFATLFILLAASCSYKES